MKFLKFVLGLVLLVKGTDLPIIAIVSHQRLREEPPCDGNCEFMPFSYVKWVEMAGGRAVRMPYNASTAEVDFILTQVNGLLLIGGDVEVTEGISYALERIVEMNEKGDFFPVWGTCLGFEWLTQIFSNNASIVEDNYDAENINFPIIYEPGIEQSRLFSGVPFEIRNKTENASVAFHAHSKGTKPEAFRSDENLNNLFKILATNYDRNGKPFVSAMEAHYLPIFAVMWHPEKANFEFGLEESGVPHQIINHSYLAKTFSFYLAQFFVKNASKSRHRFKSVEIESERLFYGLKTWRSYEPTYVESLIFEIEENGGQVSIS